MLNRNAPGLAVSRARHVILNVMEGGLVEQETPVQAAVRRQLGLRIGPEMAAYLVRSAEAAAIAGGSGTVGAVGTVALIGGDARTGVAMRKQVPMGVVQRVLGDAREAKTDG
jgi:ribosomal protein S6E (S10)